VLNKKNAACPEKRGSGVVMSTKVVPLVLRYAITAKKPTSFSRGMKAGIKIMSPL
jgi:hypothetical protein